MSITTKTTFTDNSSRHSSASTAPSSTGDVTGPEEWGTSNKRVYADVPLPPITKTNSGFFRAAGRTFAFGALKKTVPPEAARQTHVEGERVSTAWTSFTAVSLKLDKPDTDFELDLGAEFDKLVQESEQRASMMPRNKDPERQILGPQSLTAANRAHQPAPLKIDQTVYVEPSPYSWDSQHSADRLVKSTPSIPSATENAPPGPRHGSPYGRETILSSPSPASDAEKPMLGRKSSSTDEGTPEGAEEEDVAGLTESFAAATRFMSGTKPDFNQGPPSRYRRQEDVPEWENCPIQGPARQAGGTDEEHLLCDNSADSTACTAQRVSNQRPAPPQSKVMTPAQFERYRQDRERQDRERRDRHTYDDASETVRPDDEVDEDDINYDDDEDDAEKARQQAKQRRKQEAQMTLYRQQMMKVTGDAAVLPPSRPNLHLSSVSTPNLTPGSPSPGTGHSDHEDDDEEVPLAILAAHGFPGRNRPPTRLSAMMSNPNLRAAMHPSFQRPSSAMGAPAGPACGLPAFARHLPNDPFHGASLVNNPPRESFSLGGGAPAAGASSAHGMHPGGLIGVIADEERSRAARRGSPQIDTQSSMQVPSAGTLNHPSGMPSHMMYPVNTNPMPLTPGEQAQMQMTQQMQQFLQMQMQLMQTMAGQTLGPQRPVSQHMTQHGGTMGSTYVGTTHMGTPDMMRHSFVGNEPVSHVPLSDMRPRIMSTVQPSSASWIQQPAVTAAGRPPSFRAQGTAYAPSLAPSERSRIGLPGRYRPVSMAPPQDGHLPRASTMSGGPHGFPDKQSGRRVLQSSSNSDDDDELGWASMKAKRDNRKLAWKTQRGVGIGLGTLIH